MKRRSESGSIYTLQNKDLGVCGLFLTSPLLCSPPASGAEPGDVLAGAAGGHPAAGAGGAGAACADAGCRWHHPDAGASHGADGGCAAGPAGPSKCRGCGVLLWVWPGGPWGEKPHLNEFPLSFPCFFLSCSFFFKSTATY